MNVLRVPGLNAEDDIDARVALGERVDHFETVRLAKDGRCVDVSLSVSPVKDLTGRTVGFSRIARNITEQKRLGRSLERLRWMLSPPSHAPVLPLPAPHTAAAGAGAAGAVLDAAGPSLLAEIGLGFEVLMGTCFSLHESNGDLTYSLPVSPWGRYEQSCLPELARAGGGDQAQARSRRAALQTMARGEPIELELAAEMRLYAVPIRAAGEVVGALVLGFGDPPRDAAQVAAAAARYGMDAGELQRQADAYETRPPFIVELAKRRLDGDARLLGEVVQRAKSEAQLRDARDNLARSNRELERFAYLASHDLQEPLRMVASYTQLLAQRYRDQLDQDARDFIDFAVDGVTRMKQLIEDLLTFSRVNANKLPAVPVNSGTAVSLALRNLDAAIKETSAEILLGDLPPVTADRGQMVQMFQNLVGNAIKFRSPDAPPRVRIEARPAAHDPLLWHFSVADNGIGIERRFFDRLFVLFQRLHTRHEYPGTGIGLALCKQIVERHGGRIWIESEPGQGTIIHFTLPAQAPETMEAK
jgi:signal transduction histidine kinase